MKKILTIIICMLTLGASAQQPSSNATPKNGPGCITTDNMVFQTSTSDGGSSWAVGDYFFYRANPCAYTATIIANQCYVNLSTGRKYGNRITIRYTPENCPIDSYVVPFGILLVGFSVYRFKKNK